MEATTAHSNYLDGELTARNNVLASVRQEHSTEVRALRSDLDQARWTLERTEDELCSARLINDRTCQDVERMQHKIHDIELENASWKEVLERDLDKEQELVAWKEHCALSVSSFGGATVATSPFPGAGASVSLFGGTTTVKPSEGLMAPPTPAPLLIGGIGAFLNLTLPNQEETTCRIGKRGEIA